MLREQISALQSTGGELLAKASACSNIRDAQQFTDLALKCFDEARKILEENRRNHVVFFAELSLAGGFKPDYQAFLRFVERNGLDVVSESDFAILLAGVM